MKREDVTAVPEIQAKLKRNFATLGPLPDSRRVIPVPGGFSFIESSRKKMLAVAENFEE